MTKRYPYIPPFCLQIGSLQIFFKSRSDISDDVVMISAALL
jgi:hypothetical protein